MDDPKHIPKYGGVWENRIPRKICCFIIFLIHLASLGYPLFLANVCSKANDPQHRPTGQPLGLPTLTTEHVPVSPPL